MSDDKPAKVERRGDASRLMPQWKPGQSGNPAGKPKGARNKLSEDFLKALHTDFTEHGIAAIQAMREQMPNEYVRVIASLLPKEMTLNLNPLEEMEDAELTRTIRALEAAMVAIVGGTGEAEGGATATDEDAPAAVLQALH